MGLRESAARRHDPPELWFQLDVHVGIFSGTTTATVRLGERTEQHEKGYVVGEYVVLRCMVDHRHECFRRWAIVECVSVTTLRQLSPEDLIGCPPEEMTPFPPHEQLAKYYGRPIADDEPITVVRFMNLPTTWAPGRTL